jgi:hypothetical protein
LFTDAVDPDPFVLDVGDLSDIAKLMPTGAFNDELAITSNSDAR